MNQKNGASSNGHNSIDRRGFIGAVSALMGGGLIGLPARAGQEEPPKTGGAAIREYRTLAKVVCPEYR